MLFSSLDLKTKYDTDEDNILESFYIPLLTKANRYDRAVGYFSSHVLESMAIGLEYFIRSNGKMRLIIGDPLTDDEYEAVLNGTNNRIAICAQELSEILLESESKNLKILSYLIANAQLEIKFAFTSKGMFHKKVGIFYGESEQVVFSGSANETIAGLSKYNSEEISAFFSWKLSFEDYGQPEIIHFESLWANQRTRTKVVELSSDFYKKIRVSVDKENIYKEIFNDSESNKKNDLGADVLNKPKLFFKYSIEKSNQGLIVISASQKVPAIPLYVKNKPFQLFPHQIESINNWKNAGYRGLFKLATGAGKTFTSICAMVKLYESRLKYNQQTFVIISVPYIELANQWLKELELFNISAIPCYNGIDKWLTALDKKLLRFKSGELKFSCVVAVNKTLVSDVFQDKISKISRDDMLFIGDECHHLGSENLYNCIPRCKHRIGLSATPFRSEEEEIEGNPFPDLARDNLIAYFGGIISEYSLSDAINDGVLTPYIYDLVPVYLTEEEQEVYEEYSSSIQRLILKSKNIFLSSEEQQLLTNLCGKRSRLLATCYGKLPALIAYLENHKNLSLAHSLIYVGEGKALDEESRYVFKVTNALHEYGLRVSKFTSDETSYERKNIMNNFKNKDIDALIAMKVLDEGIDVPVCKSAFILASTRNPRQYVQRRGRVLRKAEGKESALIVDFVVLPYQNITNNFSQNLRNAELNRIKDFMLTALNADEIENKIINLGIL
ncbi:TPA: DEAD/DEAH box helicase family protein [Photobacterium damselae]